MRNIWIALTLLACANASAQGLPSANYREPLPLYYDAETGNATIDLTNVFGGAAAGYTLSVSIQCGEPCSAFRPENHTPFMGSIWVTADTRTISETSFENVPGGVFSLGNIFPAGLSEQELIETYFTPQPIRDLVQYFAIGPLGSGSGHAFQPIYSPSPFPALNDPNIGPTAIVAEWATEAVIRYNALTGDLWIDTSGGNGGAVFTYDIQLTEPFVNADRFTPAHIEGLGSATINDDRIVEVGWEGIPTGNYALGSIFPAGMSESELEALIDYAQFIGKPGHDVVSFDIQSSGINMSLHYVVPEPQASWLIFLSVFLFALAHHRRGITRVV